MAEQGTGEDGGLRSAVAVTLGFYTFTLVVFGLSGYFRGPEHFREVLTIGVPMMIVDGMLGFSLYFVLRWTDALRPAPRWLIVGGGVILVALLQSAWDTQLRVWAETLTPDRPTPYASFVRSATLNTYNTGMYVALLAFHAALIKLREKERLLIAAQASERDAHMLALRFQLNPHFLFNTLNAISSLVVIGRAADAEAMIDRLSTFLRASLNADPRRMATLGEEFEMLDTYLQIEGIRFGDRLVPHLALPDALAPARMPPFLLQPLVENAIKYAVAPARRPVEIRIAAAETDGMLELSVADTGAGEAEPAAPGTGVGLANIRERLRLTYGPSARLDIWAGPEGYRVALTLPLEGAVRATPVPAPRRSRMAHAGAGHTPSPAHTPHRHPGLDPG
jgi:sensor histidine kinase YesM